MKYLEQNITKQALSSLPPKLKRIGMMLASPGYLEGTEAINCSRYVRGMQQPQSNAKFSELDALLFISS
jgi:hypothetical protein